MIRAVPVVAELTAALAGAHGRREPVTAIDLGALACVLEYHPEDLTITVAAGITLAALQTELARHGQWLPVDPPGGDIITVRELIDGNPSGPRRFAHGTVRDHVIGLTAVMADGTLIHSGGKVVKNVAGYDLAKLFIGGGGSLGVVVEVTFKLRPLPEQERFLALSCGSAEEAEARLDAIAGSELSPESLDLHGRAGGGNTELILVAGFAGAREDVAWQVAQAGALGFTTESSLEYEFRFWADPAPVQCVSVLPSRLISAVRQMPEIPFLARAGNGLVYHRGPAVPAAIAPGPLRLMQRLKETFDPHQILPAGLPPSARAH